MRIETIEELEKLYPNKPVEMSVRKETPVINAAYRRLIEACPFLAIASIGDEGMDCSPRGDGPGFVKIINERTVAIPDRRGNNRLDTLRNIVADERVALLMLIPGWNETLRINGRAHINADPDLLSSMEMQGKIPTSAIVIEIDTMYFQCARALKRARLWDAEAQLDPADLPKAGQLVQSVMKEFDAAEYDGALQQRQAKTLY